MRSAAEQINADPASRGAADPQAAGPAGRVRRSRCESGCPGHRSTSQRCGSCAPPRRRAWSSGRGYRREEMAEFGQEVTGRVVPGRARSRWRLNCLPGCTISCRSRSAAPASSSGAPAAVAVTDPVRHLAVTPFAGLRHRVLGVAAAAQLAELTWELDGNARLRAAQPGAVPFRGRRPRAAGARSCTVEVRAVIMVGDASFTAPPVQVVVDQVLDVAISLRGLGARRGRPVRRTLEEGHLPLRPGLRDVRVRMVASPGRVMPTSADRRRPAARHHAWPCARASRSSTTSPCRGRSSGPTGCAASSWAAGPGSLIRRSQASRRHSGHHGLPVLLPQDRLVAPGLSVRRPRATSSARKKRTRSGRG